MNLSLLLSTWERMFPKPTAEQIAKGMKDFSWMGKIFGTTSIVLYVVLGLVGACGAIYAIYLGIQLGRAEDQSKRDDAKKHLITVLIAIAITVVFVLFFNELLPMIIKAFTKDNINQYQ